MTRFPRLRTAIKLAALLLSTVWLTSILCPAVHADNRNAERDLQVENRPLSPAIDRIQLLGPLDLIVRQGTTPGMTVRSAPALLERIRTTQEGHTLLIDLTGVRLHSMAGTRVDVTLPALQELVVTGSGDAQVSGFSGARLKLVQSGSGDVILNASYQNVEAKLTGSGDLVLHAGTIDNLALQMAGSGDVQVSGRTKALTVSQNGSGDLRSEALATEVLTLAHAGSGDAIVNATGAATILARGSGDIVIMGRPAQKIVSRSGSGSVIFR